MISFRHTSSRCPSGLRSFKRINVWETAASGVLHKRRRARGGDVIRPRESPSKSENLQRPTHSKNRAKKPTMDHPRTERKRKVLTSRHPNVPKPVDNDGDAPDLRRVALVKTKTVVDQNFNIDGNAFGVEGSIADETYIVEVTEEPSHHQAEKTEARRITINAKTATAVHKNDLMDIIGKVTFAPVDYKTASAASIINMDFRKPKQLRSLFPHLHPRKHPRLAAGKRPQLPGLHNLSAESSHPKRCSSEYRASSVHAHRRAAGEPGKYLGTAAFELHRAEEHCLDWEDRHFPGIRLEFCLLPHHRRTPSTLQHHVDLRGRRMRGGTGRRDHPHGQLPGADATFWDEGARRRGVALQQWIERDVFPQP
ncbi:hypothetical protein L596_015427 [Steinernema carpocapsae]|uniref:Uncharacterized protein n=1 Tax=Steinernema carpocapsae TaxID=34508 RepID=A0A4U5NEX6_STECR|nr:hypothetical protein L596_015427 [Steinernema carpocapsae]